MKLRKLAQCMSLVLIASPAVYAQDAQPQKVERVEITGSSIKRIQSEGALPVQIITKDELDKAGVVSAEQLLSILSINGNGMDNLASTSDVTSGENRGASNGLSAANLRSQGSNATLVLVNGRRVATHGFNSGTVDLNSIPMAAVQRVEVLKDGASAIYGTDAIGGVINFILRNDFSGVTVQASTDITEAGGGNVSRLALVGGFGDLARDRYNVMASISHRVNEGLRGTQRDFVNLYQPNRGLAVDTTGTPFATVMPLSSLRTILTSGSLTTTTGRNTGPTQPGTTTPMNRINVLDLPGQAGCGSISNMSAYDELIWAQAGSKWGCAWDTARANMIQQEVANTSAVVKATFKASDTLTLFGEFIGGDVVTKKEFSNLQITSSPTSTNPLFNLVYPSTGSAYNSVFNAIAAVFPTIEANRGQGIAYRWRCMPCGPRQIETTSETRRYLLGGEGSFGTWDYKFGASQATSQVSSVLGDGYYFNDKFIPLLRSGLLNPFLPAGQSQTPEALAALAAASAAGTTLYGGKYTTDTVDASASGPTFRLPAGDVMAAVGVSLRSEKYRFNGTGNDLATYSNVYLAPFDTINDLKGVKRDIKAVYGEVLVPITKSLEVTAAVRHDNYTGFGGTTNPKIAFRFTPTQQVLVRGSYNTGFRVPTFNQQFFGITEQLYSGKDLVDPAKCPALVVNPSVAGCEVVTPVILTGGRSSLGPETTKQGTLGIVVSPAPWLSANLDYWEIKRTGTITTLTLTNLFANASLFPESFVRDETGALKIVDRRWVNAGETSTKGVEIGVNANTSIWGGKLSANLDGTYLIERKSRVIQSAAFGKNEVGTFSRSGDIPLRWKHAATLSFSKGPWVTSLTQLFSFGYYDAVLPGVANGTVKPVNWSAKTADYARYNISATYSGVKNLRITAGVKNILNTDPPFSAAYDADTGGGSSWEPRVADPRGRAYWLNLNYDFK